LQRLSQRKYAEMLGVSNNAISKAIQEGRIAKGWDDIAKKIIVPIANREYGYKYGAIVGEEMNPPTLGGRQDGPVTLNERTTYEEAVRLQAVFSAQDRALELNKKKGLLVAKSEVDKQMFVAGQEIRKALESMPDRVVDSIRASENRAAGIRIMQDAIFEILTKLSELNESDKEV